MNQNDVLGGDNDLEFQNFIASGGFGHVYRVLTPFPHSISNLANRIKIRNTVTKQVWTTNFVFAYNLGLCSKVNSR